MPPFGVVLRAFRLRWSYSEIRKCFIRVQDRPGDCWQVEIVPPELKYLTKGAGEYRLIEMRQADRLFDLSPAMRMIRRVKHPIQMLLNDSGELTPPPELK